MLLHILMALKMQCIYCQYCLQRAKMLSNFEHNNFAYKIIENAVHGCVLLTKSRNAPNFQIQWFSLCKYVSIENAVVRNAHDEQKPSQNVSTIT